MLPTHHGRRSTEAHPSLVWSRFMDPKMLNKTTKNIPGISLSTSAQKTAMFDISALHLFACLLVHLEYTTTLWYTACCCRASCVLCSSSIHHIKIPCFTACCCCFVAAVFALNRYFFPKMSVDGTLDCWRTTIKDRLNSH